MFLGSGAVGFQSPKPRHAKHRAIRTMQGIGLILPGSERKSPKTASAGVAGSARRAPCAGSTSTVTKMPGMQGLPPDKSVTARVSQHDVIPWLHRHVSCTACGTSLLYCNMPGCQDTWDGIAMLVSHCCTCDWQHASLQFLAFFASVGQTAASWAIRSCHNRVAGI